jgi:hypothetical protein
MMHHANGECCSELYYGQDPDHDPLSSIDGGFFVTMGMATEEHECEDKQDGIEYGECDCETNTYSTSQCEGCGSHLHGERHAMTLFKE